MPGIVSCCTWVPQNTALLKPTKVVLSKQELRQIISNTEEDISELENINDDDYDTFEQEAIESEYTTARYDNDGSKDVNMEESPSDDIVAKYNLDDYNEDDDNPCDFLKLKELAIYACEEDDPLITGKDCDEDSEASDLNLKPTDNLLAVGHIDGNAALLEVYVYNGDDGSFYVHHDDILPFAPLCMEWMNFSPNSEEEQGNYLAIGGMSPVIQVWDLDIINSIEAAFKLGVKARKKKNIAGVGHTSDVLSLSWSKRARHILASGSADETVIVWDMREARVSQQLKAFRGDVESLQWHEKESECLLTGASDKCVRVFDCRIDNSYKSWTLDDQIECVTWNTAPNTPYNLLASTNAGTVFYLDIRQERPIWILNAHDKACTGLSLSRGCPGCLVTVSEDEMAKVWDIQSGKPELIVQGNRGLNSIYCVSSNPDLPFLVCLGGKNKQNHLDLWDLTTSKAVRTWFKNRVPNLGKYEETEDVVASATVSGDKEEAKETAETVTESSLRLTSEWKPKIKRKSKNIHKRKMK